MHGTHSAKSYKRRLAQEFGSEEFYRDNETKCCKEYKPEDRRNKKVLRGTVFFEVEIKHNDFLCNKP
jgi:hypothetical protein